jgi:3-dehydroquinate synthetase
VLAALRLDKKFRGSIRFVLLEDVGRPSIVEDVTELEIRAVLDDMGVHA